MSSSVMDPRQDSAELERASPPPTAAGIGEALCELLFHSSSAGVGVVDRDLRYVRINDTFAAMNGRPAAAHIGRSIFDVIPDAAPTLEPLLRRVIETGEPMVDLMVEVEHPAGVWRRLNAGYYPVRDASGAVTGVATVTLEHQPGPETERRAVYVAAREADRARVLRGVVTRLNEATTIPQVGSVVVEDTLRALDGDAGLLIFVVRDAEGRPCELVSVRSAGFAAELTAQYERTPIVRGRPISELALTGASIFVESPEQWTAEWPKAIASLGELGFHSFAAVPVKVGDQVVAVLSFGFRKRRQFDTATRDFLATLAEQCALALERVRLHEAELHAAERQAAILATVQDGFAVLDRELRFTYVNAQAETLLRKPAHELLGRRMGDVFPQAVGKLVEQAMRRVLETGERQQTEAYSPVVRGWVDARLYPAPDGLSIVFQDVSARKRRQDAIALLADASRQLATSLDFHQTIRSVTAAAVPLLGDLCVVSLIEEPEKQEWPPRLERIAAVAEDPEMIARAQRLSEGYSIDWSSTAGLPQVLRTATPVFVPEMCDERLATLAQNAEHLALMRALDFSSVIIVPLVARGVTLGALSLFMTTSGRRYDVDDLAVAQDLADRQALAVDHARLMLQAQRARAEAEAANRAKTEFLAVMSYELRTPLNAIAGYTRILDLELHGPVTDPQRTALERIRRSQVHLAEIINQVMSFARLESGTVTYETKPLLLGELMSDLLPRVEPQRAAKRLGLQVRMPAPSADHETRVLADGDKLTQIILNLLSNALKFTTAGGHVTVEVLADPGDPGATLVRVIDTGIGIPAFELESIFEPFVQVDRSLNRPGEGTGLGLAISRVLARGMGGDLTVSSTPGVGSAFTLRLRRA
jgi:signal transduction histidine kinase/PAS domain-containing protein